MGKGKGGKGKGRTWLFILGGLAVAAYLARKPIAAAAGAAYQLALKAIGVQGGQTAEAASYRVIAERRPGMSYVQATGQVGGPLTFTPESDGMFTRNVVEEGGQLWAEIK
jgi:hypothetical protein